MIIYVNISSTHQTKPIDRQYCGINNWSGWTTKTWFVYTFNIYILLYFVPARNAFHPVCLLCQILKTCCCRRWPRPVIWRRAGIPRTVIILPNTRVFMYRCRIYIIVINSTMETSQIEDIRLISLFCNDLYKSFLICILSSFTRYIYIILKCVSVTISTCHIYFL